jgi:hypothetical protein
MERTKQLAVAITISVILLANLRLGIHAALVSNTAISTGMLLPLTPPETLLLIYIYFQFQIQQPHHYRQILNPGHFHRTLFPGKPLSGLSWHSH